MTPDVRLQPGQRQILQHTHWQHLCMPRVCPNPAAVEVAALVLFEPVAGSLLLLLQLQLSLPRQQPHLGLWQPIDLHPQRHSRELPRLLPPHRPSCFCRLKMLRTEPSVVAVALGVRHRCPRGFRVVVVAVASPHGH